MYMWPHKMINNKTQEYIEIAFEIAFGDKNA